MAILCVKVKWTDLADLGVFIYLKKVKGKVSLLQAYVA